MVLMLYGATLCADAAWELRQNGGGEAAGPELGQERANRAVTALRTAAGVFEHARERFGDLLPTLRGVRPDELVPSMVRLQLLLCSRAGGSELRTLCLAVAGAEHDAVTGDERLLHHRYERATYALGGRGALGAVDGVVLGAWEEPGSSMMPSQAPSMMPSQATSASSIIAMRGRHTHWEGGARAIRTGSRRRCHTRSLGGRGAGSC